MTTTNLEQIANRNLLDEILRQETHLNAAGRANLSDRIIAALRSVAPQEPHPDSARLDWLDANKRDMIFNPNVPQWIMGDTYTRIGMGTDNLRAAIDAAAGRAEGWAPPAQFYCAVVARPATPTALSTS